MGMNWAIPMGFLTVKLMATLKDYQMGSQKDY